MCWLHTVLTLQQTVMYFSKSIFPLCFLHLSSPPLCLHKVQNLKNCVNIFSFSPPIGYVPSNSQDRDSDFLIDRFFSWLSLHMCAWEMPQLHSPSINSSLDLWLHHCFMQSWKHWKFRHNVSQWWYATVGNIIHVVLHPALLLGFNSKEYSLTANWDSQLEIATIFSIFLLNTHFLLRVAETTFKSRSEIYAYNDHFEYTTYTMTA